MALLRCIGSSSSPAHRHSAPYWRMWMARTCARYFAQVYLHVVLAHACFSVQGFGPTYCSCLAAGTWLRSPGIADEHRICMCVLSSCCAQRCRGARPARMGQTADSIARMYACMVPTHTHVQGWPCIFVQCVNPLPRRTMPICRPPGCTAAATHI
jgi:hypothetical protein